MRSLALGLAAVLALATAAHANGRDPYSSTINFKPGSTQDILAGMTFGLVVSHDNGVTWHWMCELAVGYGGNYDPDYALTPTGSVFATTFDGLKVMRDNCSFVSTVPGTTFVSTVERGPDGTIYVAAADPLDSKVYKSTDDGVTFPTSGSPGQPNDWWTSLQVAPSDAQRVYLTGYRLNGANPKTLLLKKSVNGGGTYTDMTMSGITTTSPNTLIDVVGIDPTTPSTLYIKVSLETGTDGDSIYKSTDSGATWTKILSKSSRFGLAFAVRSDGSCVAGTRELGAWKSTACNTTWTDLVGAPHIGCLYTRGTEVWACTQNTAADQLGIASDGFGIMKTTDLTTWTGVLRYEDIKAPVSCAAGTVEEDRCVQRYMDEQSVWCCLTSQLGITATEIDCTGALLCFGNVVVDGPVDASTMMVKPPPQGCCDAGSGSSAMLGLIVLGVLSRRRRRA